MQPEVCGPATFDGGLDDPRILVHRYQERLRDQLLAKAAEENDRRPRWLDVCLKVARVV